MAQQANAESDVFISYNWGASKPMVKQMKARIKAAGLEVWLDDEDIRKGDDIQTAFLSGVEKTQTVVIMMNDSYLASDACQQEMEKTSELKKRVVLVIDDPEFDQFEVLDSHIKSRSAFEFHEENNKPFDFDACVNELIEWLKRPPHYTRKHTEYGIAARQWQEDNHDHNKLLPEDEVEEAEKWRDLDLDVPPRPTARQKDYIRISRIIADEKKKDRQELDKKLFRRQRNLMSLLYGGLISVVIVLLIFSIGVEDNNKKQFSGVFNAVGEVALNEVINLDNLVALSEAIEENDNQIIDEREDDHYEELERLASLYPYMNIYTLTPDLDVIAALQDSAIPEDDYVETFEDAEDFIEEFGSDDLVPTDNYERLEASDTIEAGWYNIGFVYIEDDDGDVGAILVLESADLLGASISNLDTFSGFIILFLIGSLILFVLTFFWRNLFGKKRNRENVSEANSKKYQEMVTEELEG